MSEKYFEKILGTLSEAFYEYASLDDDALIPMNARQIADVIQKTLDSKTKKMWQPIGTAPKDGSSILAYNNGEMYVTYWTDLVDPDGTCIYGFEHLGILSNSFTHWKPLPEAPKEA